jgi:hypothetical protein
MVAILTAARVLAVELRAHHDRVVLLAHAAEAVLLVELE